MKLHPLLRLPIFFISFLLPFLCMLLPGFIVPDTPMFSPESVNWDLAMASIALMGLQSLGMFFVFYKKIIPFFSRPLTLAFTMVNTLAYFFLYSALLLLIYTQIFMQQI